MCGIVGAFGNLSEVALRAMLEKLKHRGPDNTGLYSHGDIHLGHTRLSIIDLSEESNQPLWDVTGSACIVFNGEIYNYQSLRQQLEVKGYRFQSGGDAEVLVNLYLEYGQSLFEWVNGIYAFAIWDVKSEKLLLARDPFGVKLCTIIRAAQDSILPARLSRCCMWSPLSERLTMMLCCGSLVFLWSPGEYTLLNGVKKVKPGHFLVIEDQRLSRDQCFGLGRVINPTSRRPKGRRGGSRSYPSVG